MVINFRFSTKQDDGNSSLVIVADELRSRFPCTECDKEFPTSSRLVKHMKSHSGEKPFSCLVCSKGFSARENLLVHQRIHTEDRPYQCTICERSFEHSGKLHRHMRTHTGERPHKCAKCNKTFIQSGQLVIHLRTHTGEKPYVCHSCKKGFTCSKQLKVHSRTHTGEKPYRCDFCGKSFGYNHVLKLHQVQHYGCRVYKCTICSSTFNNKKEMEIHIITHDDQDLIRPSSTGSRTSYISSEKENSPVLQRSFNPLKFLPFNQLLSSPSVSPEPSLPCLLPSINTICMDLPMLKPSSSQPSRASIIRANPLYPVTMDVLKPILEEDYQKFGKLPVLRSPSFSALLNPGVDISETMEMETPLNLTITARITSLPPTPTPTISPPPPSFASMEKSSLPPRKRRLVSPGLDIARGSVIQFAIRS